MPKYTHLAYWHNPRNYDPTRAALCGVNVAPENTADLATATCPRCQKIAAKHPELLDKPTNA